MWHEQYKANKFKWLAHLNCIIERTQQTSLPYPLIAILTFGAFLCMVLIMVTDIMLGTLVATLKGLLTLALIPLVAMYMLVDGMLALVWFCYSLSRKMKG